MTAPEFLFDGPEAAPLTVALAHGAGAPMDTPFMTAFADGLAHHGYRVARFEFPYMVERRKTGKKRPPDRAPVLQDTWRAVIAELGPERLVIGGKSMGGRIASLVADKMQVRGLVCLGYPFHATGRPETPRTEHLRTIATPTLILQGTRDAFGTREQVEGYDLSSVVHFHWLEDGDHGFKPRKASGLTEAGNWDEAVEALARFLDCMRQDCP